MNSSKSVINISKSTLLDFLIIAAGSFIYAFCLVVFIKSADIPVGGLTGLCLVVNYLYSFPVGVLVLIVNIPLFIISFKQFGASFLSRTAFATVMSSVLIDLIEAYIPKFSGNIFLSLFYGGLGMGIGIGLVLFRGASLGGSEIISKFISKKTGISFGSSNLIFCAATIIIAAVVYGKLEAAMYAIILEFIISRVMDSVVFGLDESTGVFIITSKPNEISQSVIKDLDRSVTSINAIGMYSMSERYVLICAVRKSQVQTLKKIINTLDPSSFVLITTLNEVYGVGFKKYEF